MANIQTFKKIAKGRTHIRVEVTPKSAEGKALLKEFHATVKEFEKKWKATAAYKVESAARAAKKKPAKKKKAAKKK
jgi:hypothetical protein